MRGRARRWGTAPLAVAVAVALLATACGEGEDDEPGATFTLPRAYEQLDNAEPAAAAAEFTSAFIRRDFVTAALMLHPATQAVMATAIAEADFGAWVTDEVAPAVRARVELERGGDHHLDVLRVFELAMEEATLNGGFRIDLVGGVEGLTVRSADRFTAIVDATLTSTEQAVIFELAPVDDGTWRIRQVRLEDGTPTELPFSGRPVLDSPARNLDAATPWRESLPHATPIELLQTLAAVVAVGDHVSAYLLLDAAAQREVATLLATDAPSSEPIVAAALDDALDAIGFPIELQALPADLSEPPEAATASAGDSFTFMVTTLGPDGESTGLDVTISMDTSGTWRLHRLAVVGDLASPVPFRVS